MRTQTLISTTRSELGLWNLILSSQQRGVSLSPSITCFVEGNSAGRAWSHQSLAAVPSMPRLREHRVGWGSPIPSRLFFLP